MIARQYKPIYMNSPSGIKLIIYPVKDESPIRDIFSNQNALTEYVNQVYKNNTPTLNHGQYHVLFVWNNGRKKMIDVWVHTVNEHSDSGPLLEFYGFADGQPSDNKDIASGDSLIALASEEIKRRKFKTIEEYLNNQDIPEFPYNMQPTEDFV